MGKGAVVVLEPQHPALPAVSGQAPAAEVAGPATDGDLPQPPAAPARGILRPSHLAHEFVAHDSLKAVVAPEDLEVGPADAGQMDPYEYLAGAGFGPGQLFEPRLSVKIEREHKSYPVFSQVSSCSPRDRRIVFKVAPEASRPV